MRAFKKKPSFQNIKSGIAFRMLHKFWYTSPDLVSKPILAAPQSPLVATMQLWNWRFRKSKNEKEAMQINLKNILHKDAQTGYTKIDSVGRKRH